MSLGTRFYIFFTFPHFLPNFTTDGYGMVRIQTHYVLMIGQTLLYWTTWEPRFCIFKSIKNQLCQGGTLLLSLSSINYLDFIAGVVIGQLRF